MKQFRIFLAALCVALSACGGGSSDPAPIASPQPVLKAGLSAERCGYPDWTKGVRYTYSNVVYSAGQLFWAASANTNKQPSAWPKVWTPYTCVVVPADACVFAEWQSGVRYMPGDRVSRLNKKYESLPVTETVWNVASPPESTPTYWAEVSCTGAPVNPEPAPQPTPAPAPVSDAPVIAVSSNPTSFLQVGNYWLEDGVWGAWDLTRGTYTGLSGTGYEQYTGVSPQLGPNGEVAGRIKWAFPTGTTEVKSYPAFIFGAKPGYQNSWTTPGGFNVQLLDGSYSQVYPSGVTPGSWLPLQLNTLPPLYSSFAYQHNTVPTGRGHLSYDIWLQNVPEQCHGFNNCGEITHEIMIPLDYWGGYGQYKAGGGGRNPAWYIKDVVIDGRLFHLFAAQNADGTLTENFSSGWKFIVFEPDQPIAPGTLNISSFLAYIQTMRDSAGTPWASGSEWLVDIELGVEPVDGTGDLTLYNYRVWK